MTYKTRCINCLRKYEDIHINQETHECDDCLDNRHKATNIVHKELKKGYLHRINSCSHSDL